MSDMKCPNIKIYKCSDGFVTDNAQVAKSHETNIKSNKLKCPFCQQEMICGGTICHYNPDCPIHDNPVPTEILELLDRTRKALEVAVDALKEINDGKIPVSLGIYMDINDALEQITALEQKDVK